MLKNVTILAMSYIEPYVKFFEKILTFDKLSHPHFAHFQSFSENDTPDFDALTGSNLSDIQDLVGSVPAVVSLSYKHFPDQPR